MSDMILSATHLQAGIWEGVLTVSNAMKDYQPLIGASHLGVLIDGVTVVEGAEQGTWMVNVPVPAEAISDGVQTIIVSDRRTGETLNSFSLVAGEALDDDIRADLNLLRAELDVLKKAFRRCCSEPSI